MKNQFMPWASELEKRTEGRVKVTFFLGNALSGDKVAYDAVKEGIADISSVVPASFPERFPLAPLIELPLIYSSGIVASKAIPDMWAAYPQFSEEYKDWKMLWTGTNDVLQLLSPHPEPIKTLEDIKGKVFASYLGGATPLVEALGGSPESTVATELYAMYERKVIDIEVANIAFIPAFSLHEVLGSLTLVGLGANWLQIVMNLEKFNSLPPDIQKIIDEVSAPMGPSMGAMFEKSAAEVLEVLGTDYPEVTIYTLPPEEKARWAEAIMPLWSEWVSEVEALGYPGEELLSSFIEFCKKYE